jgi:hypothetical protein
MPKIEQNNLPSSLHYALTDSQCSKCDGQLEWKADFENINQPKYTSQHCNQDYVIRIDTVKVEMITSSRVGEGKKISGVQKEEPRAIKMAQGIKEESNRKKIEEKE